MTLILCNPHKKRSFPKLSSEPQRGHESCEFHIEWVWVNRNGPITEMVDLNPAQNGGKNFFSCNAATYDSSPK